MSPVAQWLEHPARSFTEGRGLNSCLELRFFSELMLFLHLIFFVFLTLCPLPTKLPGAMKFNYILNVDNNLNKEKKLLCISPF